VDLSLNSDQVRPRYISLPPLKPAIAAESQLQARDGVSPKIASRRPEGRGRLPRPRPPPSDSRPTTTYVRFRREFQRCASHSGHQSPVAFPAIHPFLTGERRSNAGRYRTGQVQACVRKMAPHALRGRGGRPSVYGVERRGGICGEARPDSMETAGAVVGTLLTLCMYIPWTSSSASA